MNCRSLSSSVTFSSAALTKDPNVIFALILAVGEGRRRGRMEEEEEGRRREGEEERRRGGEEGRGGGREKGRRKMGGG